MPIHHPGDSISSGQFPAMLAIGDSWFWYPRNSLLQALLENRNLKDDFKGIQLIGYNGARLDEYVFGRHAEYVSYELQPKNRKYYSAVLISGAGNDAVNYRLALFQDCSAATGAAQCVNSESMRLLISHIGTTLGTLIQQILSAFDSSRQDVYIYLHSYDYPIPDGRGFSLPGLQITGPWLAKAMDECRVPPDMALRRDICVNLINALHDEFKRVADSDQRITLIDSRSCLTSPDYRDDWDNELHPTFSGFRKIVRDRWIPALPPHFLQP